MEKLRIKKALVMLLLLLPFIAVKSQDTLVVTLPRAIEIALSENPTIKVANKEIKRVEYSKKERAGGLFPSISFSAAYQRALKKQKMFISFPGMPANPDGIEVGLDNTFTGGLSASLPIIAPSLWETLKMSDLEMAQTQESARASKISLYNQVKKAYYGILMMQDSYDVIKRSYENTQESAKIIQNKYKQGTVSEYEWIRADVQVRNAMSNLVSSESAVIMSKLQLKMLMGLDVDVELKVTGKLSDFESTMYADVLSIDPTKLDKNSDIKQFEIQQKQLMQTEKIHKASLLPTLGASLNYQYMSMANDSLTFTKTQVWFPTSTFGLSLSVPLFQGGAKYYKSKQLQIQQDELKDQKENLVRGLQTQVVSSVENIKKSLKKIESNKEGLRQAEKALSISQKMYDVGMATYLDLSNAELAYINAGLAYNQAIYDYLTAKADLEKILGDDVNQ